MNDFFNSVVTYAQSNKLEMVSVVFGLISVWYAAKENILVYPTGIVAVIIASYLYLHSKLYADFILQLYYFVASVYGWIFWVKLKNEQKGISTIVNLNDWLGYLFLTAISFGAFYVVLINTNTDVPFSDSLVNAIFITAMVLMAKKKVESWVFWILGDIGAVYISVYKELHFFAVQYFIFTLMAMVAFYAWTKKYKLEKAG
jgi:nicotinamide mononucleotide transporter